MDANALLSGMLAAEFDHCLLIQCKFVAMTVLAVIDTGDHKELWETLSISFQRACMAKLYDRHVDSYRHLGRNDLIESPRGVQVSIGDIGDVGFPNKRELVFKLSMLDRCLMRLVLQRRLSPAACALVHRLRMILDDLDNMYRSLGIYPGCRWQCECCN